MRKLTEIDKSNIIETEGLMDTLIESTVIAETKSYKLFRKAADALQKELTELGIKGKWRSWKNV